MEKNTQEKIDYIYDTLKKQESRRLWGFYFKWFFRLLILIYLYYFVVSILPGYISKFEETITPGIPGGVNLDNINIDKKIIDKLKSLHSK